MASVPNMCVAQPPSPKGEQLMIVELAERAETAHKVADYVGKTGSFVANSSASRAFRRFNWASFEPVMNRSGNLRGMVVNKRMRTVFNVTKPLRDGFEKHSGKLAFAGALIEVGKEMGRIERVMNSNISDTEKYSRTVMLGGAAILRSVTSVVPSTFELASTAAQGYLMLYSEISGDASGTQFAKKLDAFDKEVTAIHKQQWDGEMWYNWVEVNLP